MNFEVVGTVTQIESIAAGRSVRILPLLKKRYGKGRWRKLKGIANVRLSDGTIRLAEVHCCEAHGIGKKKMRITLSRLKLMSRRRSPAAKFAVCIQSDDADLLTPRMIYRVLPDDSAAKSNYVRVIDNEGEHYLYPAGYFMFLDLPREVERALLEAA